MPRHNRAEFISYRDPSASGAQVSKTEKGFHSLSLPQRKYDAWCLWLWCSILSTHCPTVLTREAVSPKPPPSSRERVLPNWMALYTLQPPHPSTVPSEIVFILSKGHHYPLQSLVWTQAWPCCSETWPLPEHTLVLKFSHKLVISHHAAWP